MLNTDWFWLPVGKKCFWILVLLLVGWMSGYVRITVPGYEGYSSLLLGAAGASLVILVVGAVVAWLWGYIVVMTWAQFAAMHDKYEDRSRKAMTAADQFKEMVELGHAQSPGGIGAWEVVSRTPGAEQVKVTFRVAKLLEQDGQHLMQLPAGYGHNGFVISDPRKVQQLRAYLATAERAPRQPAWVMAVLTVSQLLDAETPLITDWWPMPHAALAAELDWGRW